MSSKHWHTLHCNSVKDVTAAAADMTWNAEISAFLAQRFAGFTEIAIPAFAIAYLFFFGIGGFFHVSLCVVVSVALVGAARPNVSVFSNNERGLHCRLFQEGHRPPESHSTAKSIRLGRYVATSQACSCEEAVTAPAKSQCLP